jgi:SpoVK/Ycf46/Vps4 family AAA+-type ATPase
LAQTEAVAPAVLWVDELEKAVSGVKSSNYSDSGTTSRVFGTLLTWMQEHTSDVVVIATANDITQVPPELIRRFDELFFVDLPNAEERVEILEIHIKKRIRGSTKLDIKSLTQATAGYTGAEIEKAIKLGVAEAFYEDAQRVKTDHILHAIRETKPISMTQHEHIQALREWAVGRAVLASSYDTPEQEAGALL